MGLLVTIGQRVVLEGHPGEGLGGYLQKFLRGKCLEMGDIWVDKGCIWGVYDVYFSHLSGFITRRYIEKRVFFGIYWSIAAEIDRQVVKQIAYMVHYRPK